MGRPPEPKNHLRRERLIQLLELEGITYYEMWKSINARFHDANPARSDKDAISHTTLGRLVKEGDDFKNLTDDVAKLIIEYYPQYRIQWLMGYDDFMTHDDFDAYVLDAANTTSPDDKTSLDTIVRLLAQARRFAVSTDRMRARNALIMGKTEPVIDGCVISHDGNTVTIPTYTWDEIANEVCDFLEFKLQREIDKANPAQ